jgi:hypothetical protein
MDIDAFLKDRDADISSVIARVDEMLGLGPQDALLAVGSVVEGLGTHKSDLDLFLVSPRKMSAQDSKTLVVGKCVIDVRLVSQSKYKTLCRKVEVWALSPWNIIHAVKFSRDDRTLLHRVLHAKVLRNGSSGDVMLPVVSQSKQARLKFHVARQMARTIQVDMTGYVGGGDYRSLCFAAQEILGQAVDALCASHLLTNPLLKWRSRMLDMIPPDWQNLLPIQLSDESASGLVWRLHQGPADVDRNGAIEFAVRVMAFSRIVFSWAESRFLAGAMGKVKLSGRLLQSQGAVSSLLPGLKFDVDFRFAQDRVLIARLNEFSTTVELACDEFPLVLLCDGRHSMEEAFAMISRDSGKTTEQIRQRLFEIECAGLFIEPEI